MIYLYLGTLVLGGVLLGASLLLGGHGDFGDAGGADGLDLHVHGDGDAAAVHGAGGFLVGAFRSLRFWTFFSAFFGMTGLVIEAFGLLGSGVLTALLAVGMGLVMGLGATAAVRALATEDTGKVAEASEYVGKSVRVLVPVRKGQTGKVRLQLRGTTVDVLATSEGEEFGSQDEAIIIDMDGSTAKIARMSPVDEAR